MPKLHTINLNITQIQQNNEHENKITFARCKDMNHFMCHNYATSCSLKNKHSIIISQTKTIILVSKILLKIKVKILLSTNTIKSVDNNHFMGIIHNDSLHGSEL